MRIAIQADDGDEVSIAADFVSVEQAIVTLEIENGIYNSESEIETITLTIDRARDWHGHSYPWWRLLNLLAHRRICSTVNCIHCPEELKAQFLRSIVVRQTRSRPRKSGSTASLEISQDRETGSSSDRLNTQNHLTWATDCGGP